MAVRPGWIVAAPRAVVLLLALATGVAWLGLVDGWPPRPSLRIDPSTEPLLPRDDPARSVYREAVRDFGDDEIYAIAVVCGDVFTVPCLDALDRAGARIARLDGVRSVTSLMDVTAFRWVEAEEWIEIRPFIEAVPTARAELEALRTRALADPVYRRSLVSDDARTAAIDVRFRKMDDAAFLASGLDDTVVRILEEEIVPPMRFAVAGRPHVKVHVYRGIVRDLLVLVPVAFAVMAAIAGVFMGSLRGVLLPLGVAVVANLWTFGAVGWTGDPLTLLTGLLAPMLGAIGSVYGVHVVACYDEVAAGAASSEAAARETLVHIRRPALVAGATTVVAFAALRATDVPAVGQLATLAMWGVASATLIALTGIPAVLALLPLRDSRARRTGSERPLDTGLAWLADAVTARHRRVVAAWAVVTLIAVAAVPRIVVDTDYLSYFTPSDPIRRDFEAVNRLLAGVVPLYVVVDGGAAGSLREPAALEAIAALQARIDALPGVGKTVSVVDHLRRLERAFQADDPSAERVPATRSAVSELLFMLPKDDASRLLTVDHARANLVVRTGVVGSAAVLGLADRIGRVIAATDVPGADVAITGNALLLSRSADGIARGQPASIAAAAAAIAVLVSWALRSPRLGAVAMVPNVVPVLLYFGLLGLGAAPLSLPTSLVGCMALGVAVDDTVHLLARYRSERARGAGPEAAIRAAVRRVGRPIVITSVMLCAGFLVVTGSRFATLQAFGVLSAATMVICLATDLVLLPALLARVGRADPGAVKVG